MEFLNDLLNVFTLIAQYEPFLISGEFEYNFLIPRSLEQEEFQTLRNSCSMIFIGVLKNSVVQKDSGMVPVQKEEGYIVQFNLKEQRL